MLASVAQIFFLCLLLVGIPVLSAVSGKSTALRLLPRPQLYVSAATSQWVLSGLGLGVIWLARSDFSELGFRRLPLLAFLQVTGVLTLASLAAVGLFVFLRFRGYWKQDSEPLQLLLPVTSSEKLLAVALLAPTAALCEEFLYRGYLLTLLSKGLHSPRGGWILASVAFGLAHSYQGLAGVVRASLLGALLAYPVLRFGSLYPSMVTHLIVDALALGWIGPRFWR